MFIIRKILGSIILFFNWVFTPKGLVREESVQKEIDAKTVHLKLYQFYSCPFCVKVRRVIKRLSLTIETRDAKNNEQFRQELVNEGGSTKVPCLRIEDSEGNVTWLYESSDIVAYLENNFA